MKTSVFLIFTTLLFAFFMQTYTYFRYKFSGVEELRAKVEVLEEKNARADLRVQLAQYQLAEYQEQVATLMPEALKQKIETDPQAYPLRNLASVLQAHDSDQLQIERASSLMEKGKSYFRAKDYEGANEIFNRIVQQYPQSAHVIEANFLLVEGLFQIRDYEAAADTVESMIGLYPESELTGFALLRLGRIFEFQDRLEDAADIYKAISHSFHEPSLLQQAKASLKAVQL